MGVSFGIEALLIGIALVHDTRTVLQSTNDSAIVGDQNELETPKKLHEFIELHATLKELSVTHSKTNDHFSSKLEYYFSGKHCNRSEF